MQKNSLTIKTNVPIETLEPISTDFFHAYGVAMAEWAGVERSLFYWFMATTRMPDALARKVFFSARSFNARAEMLQAALGFATQPQNARAVAVAKAGLKKAWQYSGFRNSITHGEAILNIGPEPEVFYSIVQGKDSQSDPERPILFNELIIASENFGALKQHLMNSVPGQTGAQKTLEEYLALIESLPNQANSRNSQTPVEQPPQTEEDRLARRRRWASDILQRGPMARVHKSRAQPAQ